MITMKKVFLILIISVLSSSLCLGQKTESSANAYLKGRTVVGSLPKPTYGIVAEGVVVVQIKVNQYGNVTEAIPGADGTTVTNKELWNAARNAAMKAHFNMKADAPALQTGTITFYYGSEASEAPVAPEYTSVRDLVEHNDDGVFAIRATFVEPLYEPDLLFSVEQEDYIIPIMMSKDDLGAVKRFRALSLKKGDTLTIRGRLHRINVRTDNYKGLKDAVILDREPRAYTADDLLCEETLPADGGSDAFWIAEQKPSFNGGDANEFSKWVNSRLIYPEICKEKSIQGRVILQFTIREDGSVTDVSVLRGVHPALDREAVRVVSSSPKWKPGKSAGKPVDITMTFPVIFQLR